LPPTTAAGEPLKKINSNVKWQLAAQNCALKNSLVNGMTLMARMHVLLCCCHQQATVSASAWTAATAAEMTWTPMTAVTVMVYP
jgi:hypothetical protein